MKTDEDVKTDIYKSIKNSDLYNEVSGVVSKTLRPLNSNKEDVVISIVSNTFGQTQNVAVNVNIYVQDLYTDGQYEENTKRCRELCTLSEGVFELITGEGFRAYLESQRVISVNSNEHVINNRIMYTKNNE